jgi:tyrosyl-tRNA synthetase
MGKTAAGAVWLNEPANEKEIKDYELRTYDYWQYWRDTEDGDVGRFLKLFTALPLAEIAKLEALQGAEINEAKKILATEATALLRGREKAEAAARTAQETFEKGATSEGLPTVEIALEDLKLNWGVLSAFVEVGLVPSNSEARRQIRSGVLRVNDVVVTDEKAQLSMADMKHNGAVKLSLGKKRHMLLKPV